MSLATVGDEVDEKSLSELLTSARQNVVLIENHDDRTSQKYKVLLTRLSLSILDKFRNILLSFQFPIYGVGHISNFLRILYFTNLLIFCRI